MFSPSREFRRDKGAALAHKFGHGYSFFPIAVFLSVNNTCNLFCKMCDIGQRKTDTSFYMNMKTDQVSLSLNDWKQFVDQVAPWKPSIDIVGVEPLMYKELPSLLDYTRSRGMDSHLTTNGTLLKRRAQELAQVGLKGLFVSLDGYPELHDRIRGVEGTYSSAVEGIEAFIETQQDMDEKTKIHINTTISPPNHDRLFDIALTLSKLPVSSITMNHFSFLPQALVEQCHNRYGDAFNVQASSLGGVDLEEVNVNILWKEIDRVRAFSVSNPVPIRIVPNFTKDELEAWYKEPLKPLRRDGYCNVPWICAGINANGDVINIFRCPYPSFGNILQKPFVEIWNDTKYVGFRRRVKKERFLFCIRCRRSFNTTA